MRKQLMVFVTVAASVVATDAFAVSADGQRLINSLAAGGAGTLRTTAQSIYNGRSGEVEVLDALAEKALRTSSNANDNTTVDAVSWACRALGQSGNKRYYTAVNAMATDDSLHRKGRKYCQQAAKQLGNAQGAQYQKGGAKLENKTVKAPAHAAKPKAAGKAQPLTAVTNGMSMSEVYALVGAPTSTYTHQTGKAWIPFNYKGGDLARHVSLYAGQGRVIFSNTDRYTGNMVVMDVIIDANETGYN